MISFKEAYGKVLDHKQDYGTEQIPLKIAMGRVLAEEVIADRDFPPFNRATKDGIAINYEAIVAGQTTFKLEGILPAGMAAKLLGNKEQAIEIMTGAVVPDNADAVVMYEHLVIENGWATLIKNPSKGQDIHIQGSDRKMGELVLQKNTRITASEIGILAAVGKSTLMVKKLPKTAIISTGNELVEVKEQPLPHQIRKSNIHTLFGALSQEGIVPGEYHLADDKEIIKKELATILNNYDVVLLSGGVSKGKYDYIPEVLEELGVEKVFHRVLQRPGKPFWFGVRPETGTIVFSFPGNPASTFANYQVYFKDWLRSSLGLPNPTISVILEEEIPIKGDLTQLLRVQLKLDNGQMLASQVKENGSGDLTSLALTDGFIVLDPEQEFYKAGESVPFVPTRQLL
ncbi:Molybdopterin molybdenumtransferase [Arenibacter antarcticus]|uniref:Molybdopterin molybdenumtransferase n=1 Tax=Arenibacter antarcticus TaxID=2040469 RepID=A0ABW5VJZ4_9FLAO|nr:molybdopterin molybdotransferase MoeA [Arenibacter sp. H213]MCM4166284.1 molybdopterin molybdenumtransferase MoeA [Arenibacter sp. H213]